MVHATTLFENLQSFMKQELDQAMATQALWLTLSSRPRVSSWPEGLSGTGFRRAAACWVARAVCCTLCLSFPVWKWGGG